jgi:hypothetical protein
MLRLQNVQLKNNFVNNEEKSSRACIARVRADHLSCWLSKVDEPLRNLRYQLVPKKMSDQEFWKRYTIAVKRIKQEVLDASAGEEAAEESSLTDSVIISRQESGLEALREAVSQDDFFDFYLFLFRLAPFLTAFLHYISSS